MPSAEKMSGPDPESSASDKRQRIEAIDKLFESNFPQTAANAQEPLASTADTTPVVPQVATKLFNPTREEEANFVKQYWEAWSLGEERRKILEEAVVANIEIAASKGVLILGAGQFSESDKGFLSVYRQKAEEMGYNVNAFNINPETGEAIATIEPISTTKSETAEQVPPFDKPPATATNAVTPTIQSTTPDNIPATAQPSTYAPSPEDAARYWQGILPENQDHFEELMRTSIEMGAKERTLGIKLQDNMRGIQDEDKPLIAAYYEEARKLGYEIVGDLAHNAGTGKAEVQIRKLHTDEEQRTTLAPEVKTQLEPLFDQLREVYSKKTFETVEERSAHEFSKNYLSNRIREALNLEDKDFKLIKELGVSADSISDELLELAHTLLVLPPEQVQNLFVHNSTQLQEKFKEGLKTPDSSAVLEFLHDLYTESGTQIGENPEYDRILQTLHDIAFSGLLNATPPASTEDLAQVLIKKSKLELAADRIFVTEVQKSIDFMIEEAKKAGIDLWAERKKRRISESDAEHNGTGLINQLGSPDLNAEDLTRYQEWKKSQEKEA